MPKVREFQFPKPCPSSHSLPDQALMWPPQQNRATGRAELIWRALCVLRAAAGQRALHDCPKSAPVPPCTPRLMSWGFDGNCSCVSVPSANYFIICGSEEHRCCCCTDRCRGSCSGCHQGPDHSGRVTSHLPPAPSSRQQHSPDTTHRTFLCF